MQPLNAVAFMRQTGIFTDPGFRTLIAMETRIPEEAMSYSISTAEIADLLPHRLDAVRISLQELEWHGWIRRRRLRGHTFVDLLYRQAGY